MSEENVTCAVYDMNDIQKILGIKRTAAVVVKHFCNICV